MASALVEKYIGRRYERWLDYAVYHCGLAGIPDEANDVLNEVLCSLLQKDDAKLQQLLSAKKKRLYGIGFLCVEDDKTECNFRHFTLSEQISSNAGGSERGLFAVGN